MIEVTYKIRINSIPNFDLTNPFYFSDQGGQVCLFQTKREAEKFIRYHFKKTVDACVVLHHDPNLQVVNG